jgi:hypothetical protein
VTRLLRLDQHEAELASLVTWCASARSRSCRTGAADHGSAGIAIDRLSGARSHGMNCR